MKNGSANLRRLATPQEIVKLAKKVNWKDIRLPSGDTVAAEAVRQIFQDADRSLKRKRNRKRADATPA